jgi:uncharacterized membrane protein YoaK (UPF0700 family)
MVELVPSMRSISTKSAYRSSGTLTAAAPQPGWDAGVRIASVDDSLATKALPVVLSIIAGSTDTIGFLGLNGLFTAHITGNLVFLVAKLVAGEQAPMSYLIAVPVFMVALALTKFLAAALERIRIASLTPLLLLQFMLLLAFLALCLAVDPGVDRNAAIMTLAGMLGVSAMAVQNAVARLSLREAPATAVMTTNITLFIIDAAEIFLGRNGSSVANARIRAKHTWPAILGFLIGCALGGACEAGLGLTSVILPTSLALLAMGLGLASHRAPVADHS